SGLQLLLQESAQIFLEVGPGSTLSKFASRHPLKHPHQLFFTCLAHPRQQFQSDVAFLLRTLGQLWLAGVSIDWSAFSSHEFRHRLPLPTYPFERHRYWIDSPQLEAESQQDYPFQEIWSSLEEVCQLQASQGISEDDIQKYTINRQWLDRLCLAYMNQGLRHIGAFEHPNEKYSCQDLSKQYKIHPRYQQLISRWLQVLVEQGQIQQEDELFTNLTPCSPDSVEALLKEVRVRWNDAPQIIDFIQNCGENLAAVLVGEKQPLELFNALVYNQAENSSPELPLLGYYNTILRVSLEELVKLLPASIHLRMIEIGGGMGLSTTALLPVLPSKQTSYTFTDIGAGFLLQAQQKFSDYPFVQYRLLDIEKPPIEQGFVQHSFDVVVACNVLHATRNIKQTLDHVHSLLAPGGILLILEITQPQLDFDMTWGLLVKPLEDEQRNPGNPFLSKEEWQEALRKYGFTETTAFPKIEAFGQHVIIAQVPISTELSLAPAFTTSVQENVEQVQLVTHSKKPDISDWFHIPSWKRSLPPKFSQSLLDLKQQNCWLIFIGECNLGKQIVKQIELAGQIVVTVQIGEEFVCTRESSINGSTRYLYTINPQERDSYNALFNDLKARNLNLKRIVHFWSLTAENDTFSGLEGVDRIQERGFYSLLFITQELGKQYLTNELQITVISNNIQAVTGEEKLCPEKATVIGCVKVIPREYPNIFCHSIDIVLPTSGSWQEEKLVEQLLAELTTETSDKVIAYRGVNRWTQTFEPIRLKENAQEKPRLREGGVYLITGGLGAIGFTLVTHLAQKVQAKLILVGRSVFPSRDEWSNWLATHTEQDDISRKILKLQELEAFGSEVFVANADVSNLQQMQQVVNQAQEKFGQINGVIHCAGVLGDSAIQRKTREQVESVLAPKVKGTLVLNTILKNTKLDFFILCSSIGSIVPLFGQIAYGAANNFLDAFAHYKTSTDGTLTVSINWYGWKEGGMGVEGTKHVTPHIFQTLSNSIAHPLFEQCLVEEEQEIYISNFSVNKHWIFDEHRVMGKPTLPGTAYLELIRAACEKHAQTNTLEIQEIVFLAPLILEDEREKQVHTILKKQGDNFEFLIISQLHSDSGEWQEYAKGRVAFRSINSLTKYDLQKITAQCTSEENTATQPIHQIPSTIIQFGSRWNTVKQVNLGERQALALLELPSEFSDDLEFYKLHPALLDVATGLLAHQFSNGHYYLPFSYKGVKVQGTLPPKVYSYVKLIENNNSRGNLSFNISILDDQGAELVKIEEYTLIQADFDHTGLANIQPSDISSQGTPENYYLTISSPGNLDTFTLQPTARHQLAANEVEIEVAVTGINFQEVLIATGLFPIPGDSEFKFGYECAGRIVALGKNVEGFKIGDEVIAFSRSSFSRYITALADFVVVKPKNISLEEAATIPSAFWTAYYSLVKVGRLCKGESVLIHSAAGGVGLAAVQIAQYIGAEVFATAGSSTKREFLRSKGVKYVMDSRSLAFADAIMSITQGKGVNVVLNSLGGEFIEKNLSILASYGRFLELGLRDIFKNTKIGLLPFEKNLTFSAIHLDLENPNFNCLSREIIQHFQDGHFSPLPYQVFPITKVADAFEYMLQAKHIGKIIVSQQNRDGLKISLPLQNKTHSKKQNSASFSDSLSNSNLSLAPEPSSNGFHNDFKEDWLLPSEGIEVFQRILSNTLPQVAVLSSNLLNLNEQSTPYDQQSFLKALEKTKGLQNRQSLYQRPQLNNEFVAPRDKIEQQIAEIWQEVLGIEEVGIHDNFFELGGDSLQIVQVGSKLQKKLNINLPTTDAFEYPTISALAKYLSGEQSEELVSQQSEQRATRLEEAIEEDEQMIEERRKARE
ncbi:hypothetical protein B4U84_26390, partial [Westiellopsis prolifica IICB1]